MTSLTGYSRSSIAMDTVVTVNAETARPELEAEAALERALAWFGTVEKVCSRFDPQSELVRLCRQPGPATPVSDLLLEAVSFALEVAALTKGAFDPTVGGRQQSRGLIHNYIGGQEVAAITGPATYRAVQVDRRRHTITLLQPLLLDLGAVAKGLAIDLAAKELAPLERFAVEAGGDLFAGGTSRAASPWVIGVRHPLKAGLLGSVSVWNRAVCTSGGYERPLGDSEHHLLDPRTGRSPRGLISVTTVAPTAMVADALGTAVFVLGAGRGLRLLRQQGVTGLIMTAEHQVRLTPGAVEEVQWQPMAE